MILADTHTHTSFSTDSDTPARRQIEEAIRLGLKEYYITDHYDLDFPGEPGAFLFDLPEYFRALSALSEEYQDRIRVRVGIELGLQPRLSRDPAEIVSSYPFDYVIGSTHVVDQMDPYYPDYWKGKTEEAGLLRYFEDVLANVRTYDCFDSCGHLDYIVRYLPSRRPVDLMGEYGDILDEILRVLIDRSKALECNTAGFKYGLGHPNPHEEIIRRYLELGGDMITIGSDGHRPEHLAYDFSMLPEFLRKLGCRYYVTFTERKPFYHPL